MSDPVDKPHAIAITISYADRSNEKTTRSTHILMYNEIAVKTDETLAKKLADDIIESIVSSGLFGIYRVDFPLEGRSVEASDIVIDPNATKTENLS